MSAGRLRVRYGSRQRTAQLGHPSCKAWEAHSLRVRQFQISLRCRVSRFSAARFSTPTFQFNRSESSVRSVEATRSVWARETADASPAVPTNFNLLPWSNTSGIRLLSGTMPVEVLPAAPLPGGVKVARRPCSERGGRRCDSCRGHHFQAPVPPAATGRVS